MAPKSPRHRQVASQKLSRCPETSQFSETNQFCPRPPRRQPSFQCGFTLICLAVRRIRIATIESIGFATTWTATRTTECIVVYVIVLIMLGGTTAVPMKSLDKNILRAWAVHLLAVTVRNQARQRGIQAHIIIVVIIVASTDAVIVTNQRLQLLL